VKIDPTDLLGRFPIHQTNRQLLTRQRGGLPESQANSKITPSRCKASIQNQQEWQPGAYT